MAPHTEKRIPPQPCEVLPIDPCSKEIYQLKQHALVGVSPFNSYFSESTLITLISWALHVFKRVTIFIPDKLSLFTLRALGYTEKEAVHKTRRQDNYLQNKVLRALQKLGFEERTAAELIITSSQLTLNKNYQSIYNDCLTKFEKCEDFRNGCLSTSSWILENSPKIERVDKKEPSIAVQYILREFPLFLDTPRILNAESSLFVYHQVPKYLESLYLNRTMISPKQGFLKVVFNNIKK